MEKERPNGPEFELSGGALCLDFANTVGDRPRLSEEKLHTYGDLLRWGLATEVLTPGDGRRLERLARDDPRAARRALRRAVAVRETIYRIFTRLARGEAPTADDLASLNAALPDALARLELRPGGEAFEWAWSGPAEALDRPLWPVLRSAAELLTSAETSRLRECAADTCSWLFLDRSRNRRRRWCDMATCGNRAKARRHYRRNRARDRSPASTSTD